jgi:hypothetical protein
LIVSELSSSLDGNFMPLRQPLAFLSARPAGFDIVKGNTRKRGETISLVLSVVKKQQSSVITQALSFPPWVLQSSLSNKATPVYCWASVGTQLINYINQNQATNLVCSMISHPGWRSVSRGL